MSYIDLHLNEKRGDKYTGNIIYVLDYTPARLYSESSDTSVSSRIQKAHGPTDHWGHLVMPVGTQLTRLGISNTQPPQLRVQTESVRYVDIASYYHYVHKPLSGIVS